MTRHIKFRKLIIKTAILLFLFQATLTFFPISSSNSAEGYTSVVCSLAGTKTIFVSFDSDTTENNCVECPACLTLNHDDNWLPIVNANKINLRFIASTSIAVSNTLFQSNLLYPSYLSRAPPA